jgi:DNA-binding Lrp family transcriptional regulator
MTRGEIAEAAGIKPEYASDRLKKLKEMGVMTEARTADGRPGWRVVA